MSRLSLNIMYIKMLALLHIFYNSLELPHAFYEVYFMHVAISFWSELVKCVWITCTTAQLF